MGKLWKMTVAASVAGALFAAHSAGANKQPAAPVQPAAVSANVPADQDWTRCMMDSLIKRATAGLILPGAYDRAETDCEAQAQLERAVRDMNRAQWFAFRTMIKTPLIANAAEIAARQYLSR